MNHTILQNKYQSIWDKYFESNINVPTPSHSTNLLERQFVFQYDSDETGCDILFVGINPSYNGHDPNENRYYSREQALQHAYFQPFKKITEELQEANHSLLQWTHIDCLVFRETNQKYIEQVLFKTDNTLDFIMAQLTIARKRIEHIKPKVIVVSNTLARRLMGNDRFPYNANYNVWMGLEFQFCPILGTQKIINHEILNGTPVFFTSMLSGQRALDNGSKQRLIWHIAKVMQTSPTDN